MARITVNSCLVCEKEAQRSIWTRVGKRLRNQTEGCQESFAPISSSSKQIPGVLCVRTRLELGLCLRKRERPWFHFKVSEKLFAKGIFLKADDSALRQSLCKVFSFWAFWAHSYTWKGTINGCSGKFKSTKRFLFGSFFPLGLVWGVV